MKAEILATGDEIRSGALVDSNSAYISEKLEENGATVIRHHCVGDAMDMLVSVIKEISIRCDIAVVTGGLGPTTDDITTEAAAMAKGVGLFEDAAALKNVESFFKKFNRPMSDTNRKQALLPEGAVSLYNHVGTAPGFSLRIEKCTFFFLPGVPYEMKRMLSDAVIPGILALQGKERMHHKVVSISTFGLPESVAGEKVADLENRFSDIKLGLRANFPQIQIKLYGGHADKDHLEAQLAQARAWVIRQVEQNVISENGAPMEKVVGKLLKEKSATIGVAESCTGGRIANLLTNVAGSSDYFLFSGVTYSNEAKNKVLGVSEKTLETCGAVAEETAIEMAEGARKASGADYGLSTTGIAGPDGGTAEKPVGTVCIGLASSKGSFARKYYFPFGKRLMNKKIFAMAALNLLRKELLK